MYTLYTSYHHILVNAPNPSGVVLCNSIVCVPAITVKCISFCNHSKIFFGRHTQGSNQYTMSTGVSAPNPSSLIKNHIGCVPAITMKKCIQTQCSSTLCGCQCTQPFISDQKSYCLCACHNSEEMHFIPQPQGDKSCRRHTQCSSTLCGCLACAPDDIDPAGVVIFPCQKPKSNIFRNIRLAQH